MHNRIEDLLDLEGIYEQRWTAALDNKKPPEKYIENYLGSFGDYSSAPRLTDFVLHGLSYEEAIRMRKLMYIEQMKRSLEYKRSERIYSPQELAAFEASISERIREYNESA